MNLFFKKGYTQFKGYINFARYYAQLNSIIFLSFYLFFFNMLSQYTGEKKKKKANTSRAVEQLKEGFTSICVKPKNSETLTWSAITEQFKIFNNKQKEYLK